MVKSENMKKTWLDEVANRLTIQAERVAELQRFCKKWDIDNLRTSEKSLSSEEAVIRMLRRDYVYARIGKHAVQLFGHRSKDMPYVSLEARFDLEDREMKIRNKCIQDGISKPETKFSDESHQIASALSEVLNMDKIVVEEFVSGIKTGEALIVRDEKDSIVVAYNDMTHDC